MFDAIHLEDQDPKQLYKKLRSMQRKRIFDKFNHHCAYCGSKENLTIDHVIPVCMNGSERDTNKVVACAPCNLDKAHKPWMSWFRSKSYWTLDKEKIIKDWILDEMGFDSIDYSDGD